MIGEVEKQVSAYLPWLEDLPLNWRVEKAKHIFVERSEKGFPNEPLLAATQSQGVIRKEHYETRTVTAQKDFHLLKLVKKNDFVISLRSFQGGIEIAHDQGIISPAYSIFFPKRGRKVDVNFYKHFFKSEPFIRSLSLFVTGIREGQNIDFNLFRNSPLPYPAVEEQTAIANFLDKKCAQINAFITKKQKLIELLKEQKQAIINKAVTKGINPNVKMQPSGIEWLGDIPEHWEVRKARFLFKEIDERSEAGKEQLLSVSHITGVTPRDEKEVTMFLAESYEGFKMCSAGDTVVNIMWAWMGALGISNHRGIVSSSYGVYRQRSHRFDSKYLDQLLRTSEFIANYTIRSKGLHSSRARLYPQSFFDVKFVIPPIDEQEKIVGFILDHETRFKIALSKIEKEIILLEEYKQSLIAEAVTGKIKIV